MGPISKLRRKKRQSLVSEWSMSEVGIPPPHNSEKPHGLGASINNNNIHILVAFKAEIFFMTRSFLFCMQNKSFHNKVFSLVLEGFKFSLPTKPRATLTIRSREQ